ncbi:MAG: peptidase M61, partial [Bacteroidota bacterium]
FDYTQENYTYHLWVMEGFTSYYASAALQRAGITSKDDFITSLFNIINGVESRPGNQLQPVAMASFDAWIKQYRPNENSYNTTISYYPKGQVLAALLDLMILHETEGQKSLDDIMQYLWEFYKEEDRGFTDEELLEAFETVSGMELDDWFEKHVYGTERPDYETIFGYAGIEVNDELKDNTIPYWGGGLSSEGGVLKVTSVHRGASAYEGGINVKDEILAVDGFRVRSEKGIDTYLEMAGSAIRWTSLSVGRTFFKP